jgi:hypothetical protein
MNLKGNQKDTFNLFVVSMFRVDTRPDLKIVEPDRGRGALFVKCCECDYYMFSNLRSQVINNLLPVGVNQSTLS